MRIRLASFLALALLAAACGDDGGDDDTSAGDSGPTPDSDPLAPDARVLPDAAEAACDPVSGTTLTAESVASGFQEPVLLTAPVGDSRLFVVEQTGRIKIVQDGTTLATPFLDLGPQGEDLITRDGNEQGLLGLAFHPDFAQNQRFYVNYSEAATGGDTVVAEYTVSADPNVADATSAREILRVEQDFSNHNGGMIGFAPDGTLWIGMGDGGNGGDPNDRAEDETQLLGKMLRIDVDGGDPYAIPSDNPFADSANGQNDPRPEIWALGVRNPWRWSFDPTSSRIYIGDVGQGQREEIDVQPIASAGINYGWDIWEGNRCNEPPGGGQCSMAGYTFPIVDYDHGGGRCSVTGGYVYRGTCMPDLDGWYFYADYCSNQVWRLRVDGNGDLAEGPIEISNQLGVSNVTSFGVDATGELYVVSRGGTIYRLAVAP